MNISTHRPNSTIQRLVLVKNNISICVKVSIEFAVYLFYVFPFFQCLCGISSIFIPLIAKEHQAFIGQKRVLGIPKKKCLHLNSESKLENGEWRMENVSIHVNTFSIFNFIRRKIE